jgi:hypothetical protein
LTPNGHLDPGQDSQVAAARTWELEYVERGVHSVSLRFAPTVHGTADHGFIAVIAAIARQKGFSGTGMVRDGLMMHVDLTNEGEADQ